jgi:hypothetical protein
VSSSSEIRNMIYKCIFIYQPLKVRAEINAKHIKVRILEVHTTLQNIGCFYRNTISWTNCIWSSLPFE